jgi:sRNA-binding regulator protein Hfq
VKSASFRLTGLVYEGQFSLRQIPVPSITKQPGENMKLRISLLVLVVLVNSQFMLGQAKEGKSRERVKAEVLKRGTGEKAKVKVKLRNGSEVRGYISKADQDTFDIHGKNSENVTLAYADVLSVRKAGMSRGAKIGIAAGGAALVIAALAARAIASLGP